MLFERNKIMFLVAIVKNTIDNSINENAFKVSFYILSKTKHEMSKLLNKI